MMSDQAKPPLAVWFEIPALDLDRAQRFYQAVLGCSFKVENTPCGQHTMAIFQGENCSGGCLFKGECSRPSADGVTIYLSAGPDLAVPLARVEPAGGKVVVPKTAIGPYGFFAQIIDTEGNRVALHSMA